MKPAGKNLIFQKCPIQNQVGVSDCGLFAKAFAVSICFSKFIYDQEKMKRDITECLENQKCRNFLFSLNASWKKKKVTKTREHIYCICRDLYDSEMVQRVVCESWLHHHYLAVRTLKRIEQDPNFSFKYSTC